MPSPNLLRALLVSLPLFLFSAQAAVVNATWNSATDVAVTAASYTATSNTGNLTLNYAPEVGTNLTIVNNTGLPFIQGAFGNLAQGQKVALNFGGTGYNFVANYYGGDGNDLVLQWADNRIVAWGQNWPGLLGDGTTTDRYVPTAVYSSGVLRGKTVITLASGASHSLALCSDGTLAAWGANGAGQYGNNSTITSYFPVAVNASGILVGKTIVAIAAGNSHSLALTADGTLYTWGNNSYGELGNGNTTNSLIPVAINSFGVLGGRSISAISAGYHFSLALCTDGTLVPCNSQSFG